MADLDEYYKVLIEEKNNQIQDYKNLFLEADKKCKELLKENQPIKPIRFEKKSKVTRDKYECGACGSSEVFKEWEYCPWCGKPIDWSKDGEQVPTEEKQPKKGHWVMKHRHRKSVKYVTGIDKWGEEHEIQFVEESEGNEPYCSECGAAAAESFQNFCPKCGADMRKDGDPE